MFGAFTANTTRGLLVLYKQTHGLPVLYKQTHRFLMIEIVRNTGPLASLLKEESPPKKRRLSLASCVSAVRQPRVQATEVGLQTVPADDLNLVAHLDISRLVAALQHVVGATIFVRHQLGGSSSCHIDPVGPVQQ